MPTFTLFRAFQPDQDVTIDTHNPAAFRDEVLRKLGDFRPTAVCGPNETHHRGDDLMRYADWMEAYVQLMHAESLQVAGYAFATGNPGLPFPGDPNPDDVTNLAKRNWSDVDYTEWHCYWGNKGFTQYNALRWEAAYKLCQQQNLSWKPAVIGECGRDGVEGAAGGYIHDGIPTAQMIAELWAYGRKLNTYPRTVVLGCTPFTASPTIDWQAYSLEGLNLVGVPCMGPHCILDPSQQDALWIGSALIVKQVDRVSALRLAGSTPVDPTTQAAVNKMLKDQTALFAEYIKAEAEGRWNGPGSVDAIYCAMKGGLQEPDYERAFP